MHTDPNPTTSDPHLSPAQLAVAWGVSTTFVRRRFRYEPGVLMLGRSMRIPRSVVDRVEREAAARSTQGPVRFARYTMRTTKSGRLEPVFKGSR